MKIRTKQFRSLSVALKELEPFIRNGEHLQTGKPFENFGDLRSRELLGNWLLCVTFNAPIDEGQVRELATGTFLDAKRNAIFIGGSDPAS
jgi:hypothetical protein